MAVLIIFPVILQTVINLIMLSIGGQGAWSSYCAKMIATVYRSFKDLIDTMTQMTQMQF